MPLEQPKSQKYHDRPLTKLIEHEMTDLSTLLDSQQRRVVKSLDLLATKDEEVECEISSLVGVLCGVKPACILVNSEGLQKHIDSLGLPTSYPKRNNLLVTLSFSQVLADALCESIDERHEDSDDTEDAHRRIGKLLGYPASSTEYFLKRRNTLDNSVETQLPAIRPRELMYSAADHLCGIVLSEDNWENEIDEYVTPIDAAAKLMIPETYKLWTRVARRQKVADGMRRLLRQTPRHESHFNGSVAERYVER